MGDGKMNSMISNIRNGIDAFKNSPEGVALKLRLNLAELVIARLQEKGWTQRKLAQETGWKDSFISRLIHSDENWTTETAGRLLYSLGIDAELLESQAVAPQWIFHNTSGEEQFIDLGTRIANGQENFKYKEEAQKETKISFTNANC